MTLTLTLDQVVLHTIMHHSSTSTYMPNFIEIKETFRGQMDVCAYVHTYARTYVRTHGRTFETGFIRSTLGRVELRVELKRCGMPY